LPCAPQVLDLLLDKEVREVTELIVYLPLWISAYLERGAHCFASSESFAAMRI
jgi:hypothetical protein